MVSQYEATLFINLFATQYQASYYQLIKLEWSVVIFGSFGPSQSQVSVV